MFKSLKRKFVIINMSIISIVMIVALAVIYITIYSNFQTQNINKINSVAVMPKGITRNPTSNGSDEKFIAQGIPSDYRTSFTVILNKTGSVKEIISYIDMDMELYTKIAETAFNEQKNFSTINIDNKQWMYNFNEVGEKIITKDAKNLTPIEGNGNLVFTFLDVTETGNTLRSLLIIFILVGIGMLFVIFAISLYFANKSIKPISEAFNKQKQFIADASHELKTPLAIINANADALLANKTETIQSQQKWVNYIEIETGRMNKLVNDLLYLAKAENTDLKIESAPFNISDIVKSVVLSMEAIIFESGITLKQNIEPNIIANGDGDKIKQVIMILLDNAVKYTNSKGNISIILNKTKRNIVFSITNTGQGIPQEKITQIFDRFYRVDPARTHENGNYGLGLSIANAIIERHGGKIYVESMPNLSTKFTFTLNI